MNPNTYKKTWSCQNKYFKYLLLTKLAEDEEDCKFDEEKHLEEIKRLYVVYVQGLGTYKLKWKQQVKDWVISSKTGLEQILIKKMPATYDG